MIGFLSDSSLTYLDDTSKLYLSTLTGRFDLENELVPYPIICKLIEYSANWVRIPARIAGIPNFVINSPVSSPDNIPTTMALNNANHIGRPLTNMMTHMAPPVQSDPSTVKSATSSILYVTYTPIAIMPQIRPWDIADGNEFNSPVKNVIILLKRSRIPAPYN